MKENEEKVKTIQFATTGGLQDSIEKGDSKETIKLTEQESSKQDGDNTPLNQGNTSINQDNTGENQDKTEGQDNLNKNGLITGTENKSVVLNSDIKQITIDSAIDEVIIYNNESEEIEITQIYENLYKNDLFTITENKEEFLISTISTEQNLKLPGNQSLKRKSRLEIKLPKSFSGKLNVSCDIGSIHIQDELTLEESSLYCDIGDISIEKSQNLKKANITSNIGNITVIDSWNVEESNFEANIGNVVFINTINVDKFSVYVQIGNIVVPNEIKQSMKRFLKVDLGVINGY